MDKTTLESTDAADAALMCRIFAHCFDAVITFSESEGITSFNPAAERMFGHAAADVLGEPVELLLQGEKRNTRRSVVSGGESIWDRLSESRRPHESLGQHKNGEGLYLEIGVSRMNGGFVAIIRDISARREADAHTRYLAHFDSLTGLPNRVLFQERLNQAIVQAKRAKTALCVMMLDLDRFKEVNDTLGHHVGDKLLTETARRIVASVRESDTVTRLGGDEFAILLTNLTDPRNAGTVGESIVHAIAEPFEVGGEHVRTSVSIGITTFPEDGQDPEGLLRNADRALYRAKAKGRNTYQFYVPELDALVQTQKTLERDLTDAINGDGLSLQFQPMVDLDTGAITSIEALVRWECPKRGWVAAREFIPVIKRTSLILRLGWWVIGRACAQGRKWLDAGLDVPNLAVNISVNELHHRDLPQKITNALKESGFPASRFMLEITEDAFLSADTENPRVLEQFQAQGIGIAIDDFGTGAVSLEGLLRHPIQRLKIHESFLRRSRRTAGVEALFSALVGLGSNLGVMVTAEGVESKGHYDFLRGKGVKEAQGHFLCPPIDADDMTEMLVRGRVSTINPVVDDSED